MSLTDLEKMNIRRHMGYPVVGLPRISPNGVAFAGGMEGYRFFKAFGLLEYRLNNLSASEEASLMGRYISQMILQGIPVNEDIISFTIQLTGMATQTINYTVQPSDVGNAGSLLTICQDIVFQILSNTTLLGNGFQAVSPLSIGPFASPTPISLALPNLYSQGMLFGTPGFSIMNNSLFTMSNPTFTLQSGSTFGAYVGANGNILPPPVSTVDPSTTPPTVENGYIPILDYLEGAIAGATQNLDTEKADVWSARMTELPERGSLYYYWQSKLADFLGVPANRSSQAGFITGNSGSNVWSQA